MFDCLNCWFGFHRKSLSEFWLEIGHNFKCVGIWQCEGEGAVPQKLCTLLKAGLCQGVPNICLSLLPQHWNYKYVLPCPAFVEGRGVVSWGLKSGPQVCRQENTFELRLNMCLPCCTTGFCSCSSPL